ncbi:type I-B CRISPR-associated protein Cas5b [Methanosphaera sp. ISO3-F5]|uniref:type I-B CRISPR-associated protein Cas5b n=1 Tax=Methanosphaera sp. ISO3-F5 TaxID=1452353 RepID=UPI002B25FF2B|nr:type I-B CRISPR-associated protein Cas5b [Methanosphaera sp. ISO3-F5]WQH63650.1 type I-B CRISPR-associated protein Cas5b [Methanosphaera sp. ISO3-F5]
MTKDVVVFDVWGDYAYFRRGYTTTSTISYPFPSRTTIAGFIAGILGYPRDSYHELFNEENSKIGIKIVNPIKKTRLNLNYVNTKESMHLFKIKSNGKRTQVPAEFLKDVKYRLYVSLDDKELMNKLYSFIRNHKSVYTPYLGITECLCNFEVVGDGLYNVEEIVGENVQIDSVLVKNNVNIHIEHDKKYGVVKSPGFMNNDRSVKLFIEYFYESNAKSILVDSCTYYKIGDDNVMLF